MPQSNRYGYIPKVRMCAFAYALTLSVFFVLSVAIAVFHDNISIKLLLSDNISLSFCPLLFETMLRGQTLSHCMRPLILVQSFSKKRSTHRKQVHH